MQDGSHPFQVINLEEIKTVCKKYSSLQLKKLKRNIKRHCAVPLGNNEFDKLKNNHGCQSLYYLQYMYFIYSFFLFFQFTMWRKNPSIYQNIL